MKISVKLEMLFLGEEDVCFKTFLNSLNFIEKDQSLYIYKFRDDMLKLKKL